MRAEWRTCAWACGLSLGLALQGCGGGGTASEVNSTSVHALATATAFEGKSVATRPAWGNPAPVCVLPWGPDLNAVLGTRLEIITGEGGCDAQIAAHRRWGQLLVFFFNDPGGSAAVPLRYPPGYVPRGADPVQDFLRRLTAVSYELQPSGQTITYTAHQLRHHLYPSTIGAVFGGSGQFPEEWDGLRTITVLPPLPPLRPGDYTTSVSVNFDGGWCDGTSDDPLACLPAGAFSVYSRDFIAVASAPPK